MFQRETVIREYNGKKSEQEVVFGVGRLTNDPPQLTTIGDKQTTLMRGSKDHRFAIALDNGKDKTEFFNLSVFGKTAENLANLGFKGQQLAIVGRIEKYKSNGTTYESLILERFQVLKYKDSDENQSQGSTNTTSSTSSQTSNQVPAGMDTAVDISDDDIPF